MRFCFIVILLLTLSNVSFSKAQDKNCEPDLVKLEKYQNDSRYNYIEQLEGKPEESFLARFWKKLRRYMSKGIDNGLSTSFIIEFSRILFIFVILAVVIFILIKRPNIFRSEGVKNNLAFKEIDDNIYDVDFDAELKKAVNLKDYYAAVRLLYLQTLKKLDERRLISWAIYKTPTEYIYEARLTDGKTSFRKLTNDFLKVRYGNFEATETVFQDMQAEQKNVIN